MQLSVVEISDGKISRCVRRRLKWGDGGGTSVDGSKEGGEGGVKVNQ